MYHTNGAVVVAYSAYMCVPYHLLCIHVCTIPMVLLRLAYVYSAYLCGEPVYTMCTLRTLHTCVYHTHVYLTLHTCVYHTNGTVKVSLLCIHVCTPCQLYFAYSAYLCVPYQWHLACSAKLTSTVRYSQVSSCCW